MTTKPKIIIVLACMLLTACAQITGQATQQDTITIGGIFGLTGMSQQFGEDELKGAQLAIEDINANGGIKGKTLELIIEDGQTNVKANLNAYRKLVDSDNVHYIIGPTWTQSAHVIVPHIDQDRVVLISPSVGEVEHALFNNRQFFKTYPPYRDETPTAIAHMQQSGVKKVAIVTSEGTFEQSMKIGFLENLKGSSISVASEQKVSYEDTDFRTAIIKLQQTNADAIYLVLSSYSGIGEFFKQAREMGVEIPIYTYSGTEQQSLLQNYGDAIEGMLYPLSDISERDKAFNEKFKERYGNYPLTPAAATAYDAATMLAIGLEGGNDAASVADAMHAIKGYEGASPITGFTDNGWPVTDRKYAMKTVRNGEFVEVAS
jgi:branched-chain amino acid transport system substrate-binding protein